MWGKFQKAEASVPQKLLGEERRPFQTEHMAWAMVTFQKTLWGPRLAGPSQGLPHLPLGLRPLALPAKVS